MLHDPPGHFADAAWSLSVRTGEWLEICLVVRLLSGLPVAPAASLLVSRDTLVLAISLQPERQDAIGDDHPTLGGEMGIAGNKYLGLLHEQELRSS
jgi:hypothetical protein